MTREYLNELDILSETFNAVPREKRAAPQFIALTLFLILQNSLSY